MSDPLDERAALRLFEVGRAGGLDEMGVCGVQRWDRTRAVLEQRRAKGFAGALAFTYRNPARSTDPARVLRHASSIIVGARSYAQYVDEPPTGRISARVARYATADHYARLEAGLSAVAEELRDHGFRAVVLADDNSLVDREAAWRAGIGWYGRNANLLVAGRGSWFVLGSVVTDARIDIDVTPEPDGCGACTRCLSSCPTDAIVAPGVIDARRCLAALLQAPGTFPVEFREALGDRIYGCDDCQEVCPPNRATEVRLSRRNELATESDPGTWVDVAELLGLDDEALLEHCHRWYIPDRDVTTVRRNLLIVLGNAPDAMIRAARDLVDGYLDHRDPVLAEQARWSADRLDSRGLPPDVGSSAMASPPRGLR